MTDRRMFLCSTAAVLLAAAAAAGAADAPAPAKETRWDDLMPQDWDPTAKFRNLDLGAMGDGDPRAQALLRDMRDAWDNAPTNHKMDGAAVKLPGYIVPLDEVKGDLKEFLLVPYFGACVHTPPPPANQIVHVVSERPLKGLRMMDAVWVMGTMRTVREKSVMGVSGYRVTGAGVERYVPPTKP